MSETFMGLCGPEADAQKCGWKPETALFMFFGGVNDILSTFMLNTERAPDRVIRRYRGSIARLYDDGARNFLLLNVPPIERIGVAGEDTAQKRADVEDFNRLLRVMRNSLMREFTDMSVRLFDTNKLWGDVLNDPDAFEQTKGITRLVDPCMAYAGSYVILEVIFLGEPHAYFAVQSTG